MFGRKENKEPTMVYRTSDKTQGVTIRMGEGDAAIEPITQVKLFDDVVAKFGDKPALHQKVISPGASVKDTPWTVWTWSEYRKNVDDFAKALLFLRFERFDTINIIGFNAPEWHFANFGAIMAGGISAGVYATNGPDGCKYQAQHSKAKIIVVEGVKQLEKYYSISKDLKDLKAFVMYGPDKVPEDVVQKTGVPVYSFADFLKLGASIPDADLKARNDAQKPNEVTSLIYTSGTTGPPKAVMITHDNIVWTTRQMLNTTPELKSLTNDDHFVSYLPLSHIAAQMIDMHCPMFSGNQVWFAQADALRGSLGTTLKEVRPTIFFGVPRVWEKIYDKMQEVAKSSKGLKKKLSTWAKKKSATHWENNQFGGNKKSPPMHGIAVKLLSKVRVALGLDRCKGCYVAAAPIETKILKYFASINIPILEVFGQSECSGPHTTNTHEGWKIGTVGRPLPGTVTKIDPNTGELVYGGRHVFAGYMDMPDKTNETIDEDGMLHSGDVVKMDKDNWHGDDTGFITITGRIKELIITAGGENVAPVLIEEEMKNAMPALSNCVVIGDKRKFLSILFCLQVEMNEDGSATNKLAGEALDTSKRIGSKATTTEEVRNDSAWKEYFDNGMATANNNAISRAQRIAKWILLDTDFSEPGGELTPTLKLKRNVVAEKYSAEIEGIYA